jgi:hypothetical protein
MERGDEREKRCSAKNNQVRVKNPVKGKDHFDFH